MFFGYKKGLGHKGLRVGKCECQISKDALKKFKLGLIGISSIWDCYDSSTFDLTVM